MVEKTTHPYKTPPDGSALTPASVFTETHTPPQPSWPPHSLIPAYRIEGLAAEEDIAARTRSEVARLVFQDWLGREVSLFVRRSYPQSGANGGAVLHIVGGAQTIHPGDLAVWTSEGYAAASFDWQIAGVGGRSPDRTTRFPVGVVAQSSATPTVVAALLPVAVQAAAVCLHWLAESPGVEENRLGVVGISWGGYLGWLLAAYDKRVRALVPAFGCGGLFAEGRARPSHAPDVRAFLAEYMDPAALGALIQAPVCYLNGTNDFFGDLLIAEDLLATLQVPVVRSYLPNVDHSLSPKQTCLAKLWMRTHLFPESYPNFPSALPTDTLWWAETEGASMHRCWLPGVPPGDRQTLVFANHTLPNGATVSSPVEMREAATAEAEAGSLRKLHAVAFSFSVGWRWEVGGTRHFSNDAHAVAPADLNAPWTLVPARPASDEPVVVLLYLAPRDVRPLARETTLRLNWSIPPEATVVTVQIHERAPGSPVHEVQCPWKEGAILIDLNRFKTLSPGFSWPGVGRLVISARQKRCPLEVGPLRREP